jgi:hypothetical protein
VIEEATLWRQFAALLPPADARDVMDCWGIGEQEAGLDLLVSGLLQHQVPIRETTRAEIAVMAESWDRWVALAPGIAKCRSSDRAEASLRLVEHGDGVPLPGPSVGVDATSADLLLVPWIACTWCGQVLARAYTREPWGDLSYQEGERKVDAFDLTNPAFASARLRRARRSVSISASRSSLFGLICSIRHRMHASLN